MIRIGLVGASGRMGKSIVRVAQKEEDLTVPAGVEAPGHPDLGKPFGDGRLESDVRVVLDRVDVVVDFAVAAGLSERVRSAADAGRPYVCGVTGLMPDQVGALSDASGRIPVVHAPNFSLGVNVLYDLAPRAAELLGEAYDIELIETHHRRKRDAPSGTAVKLVELLRQATGRQRVIHGREGEVGAKPAGEIGVFSVRTGDVVGEHTVILGGPGERLEITHRASSREAFAVGVIAAVRFVCGRAPGFYTMAHVLGLDVPGAEA